MAQEIRVLWHVRCFSHAVKSFWVRSMAVLWLIGVVAGGVLLVRYQRTAGSVGRTPTGWPDSTSITRDLSRPTLLMFVHPHCPCTRASINELNRLLARCTLPVATHVLFLRPRDTSESWLHTDTWRTAASIPGVLVYEDRLGAQARLFGGGTSGYVILY